MSNIVGAFCVINIDKDIINYNLALQNHRILPNYVMATTWTQCIAVLRIYVLSHFVVDLLINAYNKTILKTLVTKQRAEFRFDWIGVCRQNFAL